MTELSIIVPTLNEGALIEPLLVELAKLPDTQVLLSDGGSTDGTLTVAGSLAQLVCGAPGRAAQMNRAAALATGRWLWFVHADTRFLQGAAPLAQAICQSSAQWGRFNVRLDAPELHFRVIETLMNWRSCLSAIATGDQGLFVRRDQFERCGGFPIQPLMEDIELSRRLRAYARPDCRAERLLTSARRWQRHGVMSTVLLMWRLRFDYWRGVSPERLAQRYRTCSSPTPDC